MKSELLQVKENEIFTTSTRIAEKFGKEHFNVTRSIRELLDKIGALNFEDTPDLFVMTTYKDSQGKDQTEYLVNRDGFTLLAMSFTGAAALEWKLKYIQAFNDMERKLYGDHSTALTGPDNRLEIAHLIAEAPRDRVADIRALYPEYFDNVDKQSLEYVVDQNSAYRHWIDDMNVTAEWLGEFPTSDIYANYLAYCTGYRYRPMGKKTFYRTLEYDFNMTRRQKADGFRRFISA